jgi:hypothetical protein
MQVATNAAPMMKVIDELCGIEQALYYNDSFLHY